MNKTVEILSDKIALIQKSKEIVLNKINGAIAERGKCTIALAGGSTPKPLYEALSACDLPWDKIHIFWGDERYVPPTDPQSNEKMAREAWLNKVNIPSDNIHPISTHGKSPQEDAEKHETLLKEFFGTASGEFPSFDIILLGMGDDGHTASLFPKTSALEVKDKLITVGSKDSQPRITFTAPLINQAHCVIFLVAGENKQMALSHVFAQEDDSTMYPSRLIQPQGELWWLLDEAAGKNLK